MIRAVEERIEAGSHPRAHGRHADGVLHHARNLDLGAKHVGLGLDWIYCEDMFRDVLAVNQAAYPSDAAKGGYNTRAEFFPPERIPQITEGLLRRGYSETDVRNILGENWLRLAAQVWK